VNIGYHQKNPHRKHDDYSRRTEPKKPEKPTAPISLSDFLGQGSSPAAEENLLLRAPLQDKIMFLPPKEGLPPTKAALYGGKNKPLTTRPLSEENRTYLIQTLRQILPFKKSIRSGMKFCLDNAEMATEISEIVSESLMTKITNKGKNRAKKLARLYLISDILNNSNSMVKNASAFPSEFKKQLPNVTKQLYELSSQLKDADKILFDKKTLDVFNVWAARAYYTKTFMDKIIRIFEGKPEKPVRPSISKQITTVKKNQVEASENVDGIPMEDVDGVPMDEDIDGIPMD